MCMRVANQTYRQSPPNRPSPGSLHYHRQDLAQHPVHNSSTPLTEPELFPQAHNEISAVHCRVASCVSILRMHVGTCAKVCAAQRAEVAHVTLCSLTHTSNHPYVLPTCQKRASHRETQSPATRPPTLPTAADPRAHSTQMMSSSIGRRPRRRILQRTKRNTTTRAVRWWRWAKKGSRRPWLAASLYDALSSTLLCSPAGAVTNVTGQAMVRQREEDFGEIPGEHH